MTKADLVDEVYRRHGGLTKSEASAIVEAIFATVKTTLVGGRTVKITNFGTFEVKDRPDVPSGAKPEEAGRAARRQGWTGASELAVRSPFELTADS